MYTRRYSWLVLGLSTLAGLSSSQTAHAGTHSVTFDGITVDQTDFQSLGFGQAGHYFAQFAAGSPVTEKAPQDNMRFDSSELGQHAI